MRAETSTVLLLGTAYHSRYGTLAHLVEDCLVRWALLHGAAYLLKVLCASQLSVAVRVQQPKVAVQFAPVVPGQLRPNAVERDVEGTPVSLRKGQTCRYAAAAVDTPDILKY